MHDDLEVYAQPLSSDDEVHIATTKQAANLSKNAKRDSTKAAPFSKRPSNTAASARPKRRKLIDEPTLDTLVSPDNPPNPPASESFSEWTSSGSQKRRLQRSYANRKFFMKPESFEKKPGTQVREPEFVSYEEVDRLESGPISAAAAFVPLEPTPAKKNGKKQTDKKHVLDIPDIPKEESRSARAEFHIPELPDFSSSAATPILDVPFIDNDGPSPAASRRQRSGSTSSLSSVDDIYLLKHNDEFRAEPESGLAAERRCPACGNVVKDTISLLVPDDLRTMTFKKQQYFCSQHKLAEARDTWVDEGYPDIDWQELETVRIPRKVPVLKQVISREFPSFYLDELDSRITAAKGNRKAIKVFLNQGVLDVAKPGYYGPKGTRIMVNAITDTLSRSLYKALQSDSALRAAGVGGYVSAVLVPELTLRLVMEDMNLQTDDQGRTVLEKSTEVGTLLNPDDEHLEREEDDV